MREEKGGGACEALMICQSYAGLLLKVALLEKRIDELICVVQQ